MSANRATAQIATIARPAGHPPERTTATKS